jgi:DNA-binding transcriptional LysR family regulator
MMADSLNLPGLTLQQLAYLDAVARHPTWGEAANELLVSPSALSQGLAELEKRLGLTLFDWEGRRRVLRPEAGEVVRYAQQVLAQTNDLIRWIARTRTGTVGSIRVGMIDAAAIHHLPNQLRAFRRDHPDVSIHLVVAPSGALLEQLAHGTLDVAICVPPTTDSWRVTPLLVEDLAVYAPSAEDARRPPHTWGPWVTFPAGALTRNVIAEAVRRLGARFDVVAESHQPDVLREMVLLGIGWTVLPVSQAEPSALVRAQREPVASRVIAAVQRREGPGNPAVDRFVEALKPSVAVGNTPTTRTAKVTRPRARPQVVPG